MKGRRSILLGLARVALVGAAAGLAALGVVLATLPSVEALPARAKVSSTRFLDRNGQLLFEVVDPAVSTGGRREQLSLSDIAPSLAQAVIAVEDASFYANPGVDARGILRALWINLQGGETLAGGSTITQQLARLTLLSEDERQQRTLLRKLREALLAVLIRARYSKDEVLAAYLNEAYFGNLAYGAEAAARAYFGKSARDLDLSESALLAGLLQNPVAYDPLNHPEAARQRQGVALDLLLKQGMISTEQAAIARQTRLEFGGTANQIRAPHMVAYARAWAEERFGAERVARGGLIVTTTLDARLNDAATRAVRDRLGQLRDEAVVQQRPYDYNANNAAVVVVDPVTGDILAMVGSPDYFDRSISGAVNAAIALRQPGSAIKPLTYALALERVAGFTAATPIIDVQRSFPTREGVPYLPDNYDRRHVGPISVRSALATSNNVAAVATLEQVGVANLLRFGRQLGLRSFGDEGDYGLSLTLGGGEVRLLDLVAAYAAFARAGEPLETSAVLAVADAKGRVIYARPPPTREPPAMRASTAWLIGDILSDNAARAPVFGENSMLRLSRPAAAKTGTTTDWRDNWTVGYTPDVVVGVWVGNADGAPMMRISGVTGAAPIWHDVMEAALEGVPPRGFERPPGMVRVAVCALSGMLPGPACPSRRFEWFTTETAPVEQDTWVVVDAAGRTAYRLPEQARAWAEEQGWPLAGEGAGSFAPRLLRPFEGAQYRISRELPLSAQRIPFEVEPGGARIAQVAFEVDGEPIDGASSGLTALWPIRPGAHRVVARLWLADGAVVETPPIGITVLP